MKAFIQTNMTADIVLPVHILTARVHSYMSSASFIQEWSIKAPYSLDIQPQDYRIMFNDGTQALGYHWGDESFIPKIQAYILAKYDLIDKGQLDAGLGVTGTELIVCEDNEHPVTKLPNVKNYSLGSSPYDVITVNR